MNAYVKALAAIPDKAKRLELEYEIKTLVGMRNCSKLNGHYDKNIESYLKEAQKKTKNPTFSGWFRIDNCHKAISDSTTMLVLKSEDAVELKNELRCTDLVDKMRHQLTTGACKKALEINFMRKVFELQNIITLHLEFDNIEFDTSIAKSTFENMLKLGGYTGQNDFFISISFNEKGENKPFATCTNTGNINNLVVGTPCRTYENGKEKHPDTIDLYIDKDDNIRLLPKELR